MPMVIKITAGTRENPNAIAEEVEFGTFSECMEAIRSGGKFPPPWNDAKEFFADAVKNRVVSIQAPLRRELDSEKPSKRKNKYAALANS